MCIESTERQNVHMQVMKVYCNLRKVDDRKDEVNTFIKSFVDRLPLMFFPSKISKYETNVKLRKKTIITDTVPSMHLPVSRFPSIT